MTIMMMIMTDPFATNLVVKGPVVKGSVVKGATSIIITIIIMVITITITNLLNLLLNDRLLLLLVAPRHISEQKYFP